MLWLWLVPALLVLALFVIAIWLLRRSLFAVTVEGGSMEPTLVAGDRLLARRVPAFALCPGQIVIIEKASPVGGWHWDDTGTTRITDGHWMIKRVAAVPGDPVPPGIAAASGVRVPPGSIVVLGDNREASIDSRELGLIPVTRVLGVSLRHYAEVRSSG